METVREHCEAGKRCGRRMAQEVVGGASVVQLQFLASEFYEALKAELDQTHEAVRVGALAAAVDRCPRSAENCTSAQLMLVEIKPR